MDINECQSNPCQNSGVCRENAPGLGFRCFCPQGFTGALCQMELNECASQPCQNGATCEDRVNAYMCVCATGFVGDQCQLPDDRVAPSQTGGVLPSTSIQAVMSSLEGASPVMTPSVSTSSQFIAGIVLYDFVICFDSNIKWV